MKQSEIFKLQQILPVLDGKGSTTFKWAVYRTNDTLKKEVESAVKFIDSLKPKVLKDLLITQHSLLQKCKTKQEQQTAMLNWKEFTSLQTELKKFTESTEYQKFMDSENSEFSPYLIKLSKKDIQEIEKDLQKEGLGLNNDLFWCLEQFAENKDIDLIMK